MALKLQWEIAMYDWCCFINLSRFEVDDILWSIMKRGEKIQAIRTLRWYYPGTGLKEAKDYVEAL